MTRIKTRIPPSPTGRFHIGTARTALFNYLYAKKHDGLLALRIEDTDKARSRPEFEADIIEGMQWLGLSYDEFVRQSERANRHAELLHRLVSEGKAYLSKEASEKEEGKEVEVVRLKNDGKDITFRDEIRGDITFHTGELGDFVIARSTDDPLYHFAVVVDDADMEITHVIRGEDHVSNTPRQILIQEAFGFPRPVYAHLPLILAPDRSKLSKRHGAVSLIEYREEGFLPEALINYLALLGWSPGNDREDFTLAELIPLFDLGNVQKSGAVFNSEKLRDVNQRYMRALSDEAFLTKLSSAPSETLLKAVPLLKERAHTFTEAREMLHGELACLFEAPKLEKSLLLSKEPPESSGSTRSHLEAIKGLIEPLSAENDPEFIKGILMPYADQRGRGAVLWPLRYALSGREKSPDPFTLIFILGKKEALSRIENALALLD